MGMLNFRAERNGMDFAVSYVLLFNNQRYSFRGVPDFIVHKKDVGAGRILVMTGEIQSTNHPAVQNSIYGVGSLMGNDGRTPILCLAVQTAQLSVARLSEETSDDPNVMGAVSLKYVLNPSPMDLQTVEGVKSLAARLYRMLAEDL